MPLGSLTPREMAAYAAAIARCELMGWLRKARLEDRLQREAQASQYGVRLSTYEVYRASQHPPGLPAHLSDRRSRKRRGRSKVRSTAGRYIEMARGGVA